MSTKVPPTKGPTAAAIPCSRSELAGAGRRADRCASRRPGCDQESQIGPSAGIPRLSRPWTTDQVTFLFDTQITASEPDDRYAE